LKIVERLQEIAGDKNCSTSQLALAWLLAQGEDIVPIFGTRRREHLEENLKALEISLSAEDLQRIDEVAPRGAAAGTRYPEAAMRTVNA
jgi:aryl-alcohol dehydrogenase-like predicted oxidoreductase